MSPEKVMAITPHDLEAMAIRNNLQIQFYSESDCLSSRINYLLAGILFALQDNNLSSPEQATVLDFFDGLLRLKIDLKQKKGVSCG